MSDEFLFAEDTEEDVVEDLGSWKILIVDDEPEVHAVTKLALSNFIFLDQRVEFVSAYSGAEARDYFRKHNDIAIVLLDVVMETDDAGLRVADFIRNEIHNHFTRIILRTGQPGQAPERDVIVNYDINDYKSKTELTAQKLFTVIISTLRSYRDIIVIEENRKGLEKIISASADLFSIHSLENFIEGIIQQLSSLLGGTKDAAYITTAVAVPDPLDDMDSCEFVVFSGKGEYSNQEGKRLEEVIKGKPLEYCRQALREKTLVCQDEYLVAYCKSQSNRGSLLYLSGLPRKLNATDRHLLEIFAQNVQIAFENVLLTKDIEDTQREIIVRLGQALEKHFSDGKHIYRMALICDLIAREYGIVKEQREILKMAVPLHDVGKVKIPEEILTKAGRLSPDEAKVVRTHAEMGYALLKGSNRPIVKTAALIARDHHEHWDGGGYPRGLKGEDIHIFCRITSIADVYDALRTKSVYKEAWSREKVLDTIKGERGKQFDPDIVDIVVNNVDRIEAILTSHPDQSQESS